jgi:elongation factor Ts
MEISSSLVKDLREKTGAGMMDCKNALVEAGGDEEKAIEILRKKGLSRVAKRSGREAKEGVVEAYIHTGAKLGVLIELNSETDFVAKTDEFRGLAREIALHVAAANPLALSREEVPAELVEKEKEIFKAQLEAEGKKRPPEVIEKIVTGKLDKFFGEVCLLEQPSVKYPEKTIRDMINEAASKLGENIVLRRFCRFKIGE